MHSLPSTAIRFGARAAIALFDSAATSDGTPFDEPDILLPHVDSTRFGWTHFGVMIPDLPEPHRFFSMMSLIGATGSLAFDDDIALAAPPRRNASVVAGTAVSHPDHVGHYAIGESFRSAPDGSMIRFGDDLVLTGHYPHYEVSGTLGGVDIELRLNTTDKVSWFFRSPIYKHFGLLTEYEGTLTHSGERMDAAGLCSFEYGACPSPYALRASPVPSRWKAPLDHFVYQIVNLDENHQILLSRYAIGGTALMTTALLRSRDRYGTRFADVDFEIVRLRDEPEPTPYGIAMPVPSETRFIVRDNNGSVWLDLHATMDTPWTYGLGTGFVTGFRFDATWKGAVVTGRGYFEYIDRRRP